eukprot:TRINITY_DN2249_c0_g1_i1.p1 TRINITY_DN2249_c0_g1~~TRINITY_DN2249_c0_g1_i1.p1  ORF type:complete len:218 (+),score=32.51 TRINITY_DN2249_c0_g1_i1:94-747(+)
MNLRRSIEVLLTPPAPKTPSAPNSPWSFFKKDIRLVSKESTKQTLFKEQLEQVKQILKDDHLINEDRLEAEVNWFFRDMGIHPIYFETTTAEEIAQDIGSLYSAKCIAHFTGGELELKLQHQSRKGRIIFVARSAPGSRTSPCTHIEHMIEQNYLGAGVKVPHSATVGGHENTHSKESNNSSGRLTLPRLTLDRNPWSSGERAFHPLYRYLCQHSHF